MDLRSGPGFIFPPGGGFVKIGSSYRFIDDQATPVISIDFGKVFLDSEGTRSEQATLLSMLGGMEIRSDAGFLFSWLAGARYSARNGQADLLMPGFQLIVGYSL